MTYALAPFASIPLDEALLEVLIAEHEDMTLPRLQRLWRYYRNALAEPTVDGASCGPPAQQVGLPDRLLDGSDPGDDRLPREIVIENDIAWRIHTLVDFMFPSPPRLVSQAADPHMRRDIENLLQAVIDANGGIAMWQNAALLGSVYGYVDLVLNCDDLARVPLRSATSAALPGDASAQRAQRPGGAPSKPISPDLVERIRSSVHIETVEAPRAIPLVNRYDYRALDGYILYYRQPINDVEHEGLLARLSRVVLNRPRNSAYTRRASTAVLEIYSATHRQRYEDGELVLETVNRLGRLPVVHIQNLSQPLTYEGLSDVEPLIPLQDELNTRMSDRANRVTMQSFRMWLGKGIDGFTDHPIGPGQMWFTDNLDASIEGFGGDAESPSEKAHIEEIREALDKASGVTPAAAGHIRARVGNLTSENALRISLMGTIAKVKRKRVTYGAGIQSLCDLVLHALDVYGLYRTNPSDRRVEVVWTDPLPADETRRLQDALLKAQLGVPAEILRAELGYPDASTATTTTT